MSDSYYLACESCKVFLSMGSYCPISALDAPAQLIESSTFVRVNAHASEILAFLAIDEPESLWPGLAKDIQYFVQTHVTHYLNIYSSNGDTPWWPDHPNWYSWREIQGSFFCQPFHETDVDLPLNIILDLGITDWPTALSHYKEHCACVSNPEQLESIFHNFVNATVPSTQPN